MTRLYKKGYTSSAMRGREEDRPWDLKEIIKSHSNSEFEWLDIGCGTCSKILSLSPFFKRIYAMDPSLEMREYSLELVKKANIKNIEIVDGTCECLPFEDECFDVVTVMLAPFSAKEIHRVLKKEGRFIIEVIGEQDKINMKILFGKDSHGWRGQNMNFETPLVNLYQTELVNFFEDLTITSGFWDTFYTLPGLLVLLEQTSTVRDFDRLKDAEVIEKIKNTFLVDGEIKLTQNRILITGRKRG